MANYLYVDNSNVWIEGMHVAAVRSSYAPDILTAQQERITAPFRIDFGKLYGFAGGSSGEVGRAALYGSRPPANDSVWELAKSRGFEPVVFDRNVANREKKIDTQIAADIVEDLFTRILPDSDEITLVSGDSDFEFPWRRRQQISRFHFMSSFGRMHPANLGEQLRRSQISIPISTTFACRTGCCVLWTAAASWQGEMRAPCHSPNDKSESLMMGGSSAAIIGDPAWALPSSHPCGGTDL